MIRYYSPTEINRNRWDKLIAESVNSLPYACTWYLDAVYGDRWNALIEDDYKAVMPLPFKEKYFVRYLSTPLFVQQLGVFSVEELSADTINRFITELQKHVKFIDFNFNFANLNPCIESLNSKIRHNLVLKIPNDRHELPLGYSENLKRNIKKAENLDLFLSTCSIRSIINLFSADKAASIPNWKIEYYNVLERLYHMASLRGYARALGVYSKERNLLCGACFIEWNGRSIFLFSGNSAEGKESGAMAYLIHLYFLEMPQGTEIFDFEGSDNPGLKRFYESFGAIEQNYLNLKHNSLPFYLRWLKS
jgi:hypothetical protein